MKSLEVNCLINFECKYLAIISVLLTVVLLLIRS